MLIVGGIQLRAGLWQKYGWLGTFLMGLGMYRKGLFLLSALPVCLFFLSGGYRWYDPQNSTLVLPSGEASKQKCGEPQAHPLPLGPSVTHSSKSSVAGVRAGTLGAVFTALVCVSSPLAPLQPLLGVRVPPPE